MTRQVYMNGALVPEHEARISIYDSALMFGDMVFEMTRSFNKEQFRLREHLERLYRSAQLVSIDIGMTIEDMEAACLQVIEANDPLFATDDEHRLMINVSRGLLGIYAERVDVPSGTNVVIADFPLRWTVSGMKQYYDHGINLHVPNQRAIPSHLLEAKAKNRSRLHYMMANIEVSRIKGERNWALLVDPDGFVAEGTGSNIFIVSNGRLITPEPRNILVGISRNYVLELADQLGLEWVEKNIEPFDIVCADEAFLTATPFCIIPAASINGHQIGDGPMGPITRKLLDTWGENVGVDIVQQIVRWENDDGDSGSNGATPYRFSSNKS